MVVLALQCQYSLCLPATDWHWLQVKQGDDTVLSSLAEYLKKGVVCFGFVSFVNVTVFNTGDMPQWQPRRLKPSVENYL